MLERMERDAEYRADVITAYNKNPALFIDMWVDTVDPRNASMGLLTCMPFRLFPRQRELIQFFHACVEGEAHGIVEKSRDMGATWSAVAYAVWMFLFRPGAIDDVQFQLGSRPRACPHETD